MANSVITNASAMAALRSLNTIGNDLSQTQSRIETGLRVSKASDDPAVFSIAQGMRADIAGLKAVQDGLSFGKAALGVANAAAKKISDELASLKNTVTQGQQQGLDSTTMNNQINKALENINKFAESATFNGVNLLKNAAGGAIVDTTLSFLQDITGTSITINNQQATSADLGLTGLNVDSGGLRITFDSTFAIADGDTLTLTDGTNEWVFEFTDGSAALTSIPDADTQVFAINISGTDSTYTKLGKLIDAVKEQGFGATLNSDGTLDITGNGITDASAFAVVTGTATDDYITGAQRAIAVVDNAVDAMGSKLASLGAYTRQVEGLQDFSKSLMDSLKEGLGALVDADLAEESARLQSLQTRQQLAIQSLSIANQQPQALLGLFR